ncbi:hypothetical protein ACLOJK_034279, partial [Asimina triloba]
MNDGSHAVQQHRPTPMTSSHGEATIVRSNPNQHPPNPFLNSMAFDPVRLPSPTHSRILKTQHQDSNQTAIARIPQQLRYHLYTRSKHVISGKQSQPSKHRLLSSHARSKRNS